MRKLLALLTLFAANYIHAQDAKMNSFISSLMKKMTIDEKMGN